ncbi:MAG: UDP-N-acetylglucosamine 2-epimerase [Planctomycetota bacterium]|nr:UDP-N-acetylglucosamine 2-epimerase [Planctomycetota bacterium]
MHAIDDHPRLILRAIATGTHLLPPAFTVREVEGEFEDVVRIEMRTPGDTGRFEDARALGRGVSALAGYLASNPTEVVFVLGDHLEGVAAAAAASVAGIRVAHMHGGDRAEGVADEAMRHAITKLAHVHLPATEESAQRIIRMGEDPQRVHVVGSPAIDGLDEMPALDDGAYEALGRPEIVFLHHPVGGDDDEECAAARRLLDLCRESGRVLALHPNHDPGRDGVLRAIEQTLDLVHVPHLPRARFIGLLRRVKAMAGNSSAGLIECAALPLWCINVGPRQAGREKPDNVLDCADGDGPAIEEALRRVFIEPPPAYDGRYGDGRTGPRTAELLATFPPDNHPVRKQNSY